jgi:putative molybdopterin biosynthesis protein
VPRGAGSGSVFARELRPLLRPGTHKLIGSHTRRQGLMLGAALAAEPRDGAALLRALAAGRWRFVNRQPGSGTRLLLEHLLAEQALDGGGIQGYDSHIEETHVAVAAAVAAGTADVGLGVEAAAHEFGLAFVPLAEEDYYLVCLKAALDTPAVLALRLALASPAWAEALQGLPGYGLQRAGEVLSLTRALPWWRYRKQR